MKNILQNIELDIEDNQTYILRIKDKYFNNCWFNSTAIVNAEKQDYYYRYEKMFLY